MASEGWMQGARILFWTRVYCYLWGHNYVPNTTLVSTDKKSSKGGGEVILTFDYKRTGTKTCENCGKTVPQLCYYCAGPIGKDSHIVMGKVTCAPCGIEHEFDWDR